MLNAFRFAPLALIALAAPALAQVRPVSPPPLRPVATAQPRPAPQGPQPMPRAGFLAEMDNEFLKMDADKDGFLTRKEIEDYQRIAAMAMARQKNQNLFAALDADRNGAISPVEFQAMPMQVPQVNPATVLAFDGNRDGRVSKVENRAGTLANFDRIDTDKDGIVSAAEMKAAGIG